MDYGKIHILWGVIIMMMLQACVKDPQDIPSGITSDPVFGMRATFGNEEIRIDAGTEGWTMVPIAAEQNMLDTYTAIFSRGGCLESCVPSWTFRFYQTLPDAGSALASFGQTVKAGPKSWLLSDQERDSFEVTLATHPGLFMSGYSFWEDLNTPSTSFFHEFQTTVGHEENINVCFQSLAYTGCNYMQCVYFDPVTAVPCLAYIEPIMESPRFISLNLKPEGTPPFQIEWFNQATSSSIVIPIQDTIGEIYATVKVTDAMGNHTELRQSIRFQEGIVDACYFPVTLRSVLIENMMPEIFADRVDISFTDENGHTWRSSAGIQPMESYLTIGQIQSYELSPAGQPSYVVDLIVKVLLFHEGTGESRLLETSRLTVALSHP